MSIELRPITAETVIRVVKLDAGDDGRQVAPNAVSIAQAHFEPAAWFRAIYAADVPVGFVMLYDPSLVAAPESPHFYLWRLMIDRVQQGRGYGHAAVERLVEHVRSRPAAAELRVSHVPEAEALSRFYQSLGFRYTGEVDDGELVMTRPL
jgi:diamine N-acetyltransferase